MRDGSIVEADEYIDFLWGLLRCVAKGAPPLVLETFDPPMTAAKGMAGWGQGGRVHTTAVNLIAVRQTREVLLGVGWL